MPNLPKLLLVASVASLLPIVAMADVVLSSNDAHTVMDAGKNQVAPNPAGPDTVTVIDVKSYPPKIKATFEAPGSVVGPPGAIWISKDETWGSSPPPPRPTRRPRPAASPPTTACRCST
jgi:hypothetical protein